MESRFSNGVIRPAGITVIALTSLPGNHALPQRAFGDAKLSPLTQTVSPVRHLLQPATALRQAPAYPSRVAVKILSLDACRDSLL